MPTIKLLNCIPYVVFEAGAGANPLDPSTRVEIARNDAQAGNGSVATVSYGGWQNELSMSTGEYKLWGVGGAAKIGFHYTKENGQPDEIEFTFEWK